MGNINTPTIRKKKRGNFFLIKAASLLWAWVAAAKDEGSS